MKEKRDTENIIRAREDDEENMTKKSLPDFLFFFLKYEDEKKEFDGCWNKLKKKREVEIEDERQKELRRREISSRFFSSKSH